MAAAPALSEWPRGPLAGAADGAPLPPPGPPTYLGAAVQGGLAEGAAAQGADGDVVQLLLLAGHAAGAAGAAPARGLVAEVGADGVAVPLVLAQRHGDGGPARPGAPSARPRGLHVGSRRRPGTASRRYRRRDLRAPAPPGPAPAPPAAGSGAHEAAALREFTSQEDKRPTLVS